MTDNIDRYMIDLEAAEDAAIGWFPAGHDWDVFPPSFDEWNALRLATHRPPGAFTDYLAEISQWPAAIDEEG